MSMNKKVILITGASSGMGKATAFYLAEKGVAALTLFARRREPLDECAKELKEKFPMIKTLVVVGDAGSAEDNQRAVDETVKKFGGLHGAFLNAGVFRGMKVLTETGDDIIDDILNINIKSVIYGFKSVIPAIKNTVGENGPTGSIVVNSSCMGQTVIGPKSSGGGIYSAGKAFVNSLVETAAVENAPRIRVNAVLPGVVRTNIMPVDEDSYQKLGPALQPLWGRPGKPEEVASLVGYLISDEASFISGTNIKADGLWSLSGSTM